MSLMATIVNDLEVSQTLQCTLRSIWCCFVTGKWFGLFLGFTTPLESKKQAKQCTSHVRVVTGLRYFLR